MDLFRKKSMEHLSGPEKLNDYIRVATIPVWLVLIAIVLLLVGMICWGIFGEVTTTAANGVEMTIHPIEFVIN
jgi:hypothetical protein